MTIRHTAAAAIAVAGTALSASAQLDLYLVHTEDLFIIHDDESFWAGNNPSAIAYDGANLYVGGFLNGSVPAALTTHNVQIVRIENPLGDRTFTEITASREFAIGSRGYTGMDWDDEKGLLATIDLDTLQPGQGGGPAVLTEGAARIFTFDGLSFVKFQQSPNQNFRLGSAGPAWDRFVDGSGYDHLPFDPPLDLTPGDGTNDGAIPTVLTFGDTELLGLFEGLAENLCTLPDQTQIFTDEVDCLSQGGTFNDDSQFILSGRVAETYFPDFVAAPQVVVTGSDTIWRDIDIHPTDGTIALRANNQLVVVPRNPDGTAVSQDLADRVTPGGGTSPFITGQNCAIMHGATGGDLVAWNDRSATDPITAGLPAASFDNAINLTRISDKGSVAANWLAADGTALTFGDGNDIPDSIGYYDFFWHEPDQLLLISDFNNRLVYFFSTIQPGPDCLCEFGGSADLVDIQDLLAYLALWFAEDAAADLSGEGDITIIDLLDFLACWFAADANGGACS